jgi:hypothetical protein
MRKLMGLVVLFCSAVFSPGIASEKPDHLLMLAVKSKDGKTQHGEQMVSSKTCRDVGLTLAMAKADKAPVTMTLSSKPKVAGEVLIAVCITPDGGTAFLAPIGPDTPIPTEDINPFFEYLQQGVNKMAKKP